MAAPHELRIVIEMTFQIGGGTRRYAARPRMNWCQTLSALLKVAVRV